jgi:glycosyltransferase involved in cell wall biosynthesis
VAEPIDAPTAMASGGLKIAIIGSRGIPSCWTGFETFAEELSVRLVQMGHEVTVYARKEYAGEQPGHEYKGVKLVYAPYLKHRELERLSHEIVSLFDSIRRRFDIYYVMAYNNAWVYIPARLLSSLTRRIVVINTDGMEWKRRKWSPAIRGYLKANEWIGVRLASNELVSDSMAIQRYYRAKYGASTEYLTNGGHVLNELPAGALDQWELEAGAYYLVACRIEPDNNIDIIVREFVESGSKRQLVIAGGMNYETPFLKHVQDLALGHRVRFLGPVYGDMLVERLHLGCFAYLHGHEVGGTNPSLVKAMGCGNTALALDTEFNTEVLDGNGLIWDKRPGSLAAQIRWSEEHPDELRSLGRAAQARVAEHYSWDSVAAEHDRYFRELALKHRLGRHEDSSPS